MDVAILVLGALDEHVDQVADFDGGEIHKLRGGNHAFGFSADVHEGFFRTEFNDGSLDDLAGLKRTIVLLQELGEGLRSRCHNQQTIYRRTD